MDLYNIGFSNIRLPNDKNNYIYKYSPIVNIFPEEVFIHEFLHAICFPKDKIKELWLKPNELSAFIYCTAPLKKARFIWLCLCPNIILGLLPLLLWFIGTFDFNKTLSLFMLIISFLNLLCGIGDYYNTYLVIRQVPKNALVQTHGLKAYWFIP